MRATAQGPEDVSLDHLEEEYRGTWRALVAPREGGGERRWPERERENANVGGSLHRTLNRLERQCRLAMARPFDVRAVIQIDSSIHLVKEALPRDTNQWFITGCRNACGRADVSPRRHRYPLLSFFFRLCPPPLPASIFFQFKFKTRWIFTDPLFLSYDIVFEYQSLIAFYKRDKRHGTLFARNLDLDPYLSWDLTRILRNNN